MRKNLNPKGSERLIYEIREIVKTGKIVEKAGKLVYWENIGDPIAKGFAIPNWLKEILADVIKDDSSWGYCPTAGDNSAVQFLIEKRKQEGLHISEQDLFFFNGLGDAVACLYNRLCATSRVILPSPTYSAHALGEKDHAGGVEPLFYQLDPENDWQPDLKDLRIKIESNPNIVAILIINPDNPTGTVFKRAVLEEMVAIAKEYKLFIIADEIYQNLVFGDIEFTPLHQVIGDVPGISMQGLSKDVPWPGSRCGWVEIYNQDKDKEFAFYIQRIKDLKMSQVCSTTMPQKALPRILGHPEYKATIEKTKENLRYNRDLIAAHINDLEPVISTSPNGALYYTIVFKKELLNEWQFLEIENVQIKELVENAVKNQPLDKRFVYYMLAAKGVCAVPLSSFFSEQQGFRMTLLETDRDQLKIVAELIREAIHDYFTSTL